MPQSLWILFIHVHNLRNKWKTLEISSAGFTTHNVTEDKSVENQIPFYFFQILKYLIIYKFPCSSYFWFLLAL